ncbi:flagellar biosynthetic protein FliR [Hyphococcus luteus]|uniref:Flagellar biosynthesis protein FliR n=1 Tax=Hyphococcus luteus TaxID=2058213 RepID=A0A2S7K8Q4_9PROT|nr:flagellar biosynthetic protein FliR [Marinicaulis flavus]PQA88872.1 flagellar biosynthesis protein FliR [Marinicaulis flavus]
MDALASLSPLVDAGAPMVILIGAVFTRISAVAFLLPGLGERAVPARARLAAAIAIAMVLTPMVITPDMRPPDSIAGVVALYAAEFMSGAIIGFAFRMMIFILQIAGAIIAQSVSLSQLFGPTVGFDSESPFAAILVMAGVAIAAASGLHIHIVSALADLYETLPFGQFPGAAETGEWAATRTGAALMKSLALASPFVILGFLYSLALAAASRAMPQLMAAFVGAPAVTLAGLGLFAAAAPIILFEWLASFQRILFDIFSGSL